MLIETLVTNKFIKEMDEFRLPPKDKGILEACSENVVLFAEKMLGFRLYAWQVKFLISIQKAILGEYFTKEFLVVTSRQIGKSTAIAILALWACVFNKYPGTIHQNTLVGVVSASDTQAKKLLYEIKKMIHIGDTFLYKTYMDEDKHLFIKKFFTSLLAEDEPNNTTTITFKAYGDQFGDYLLKDSLNGSVIKSYPPTAVVLGETFSIVIIDEAGKSERITDQFFYDYAYPTGNSTDAIRIYTSTPWTPSGFFYRLADPANLYTKSNIDKLLFSVDAIKKENPKYHKVVKKTIDQMNSDGKTDEVQRAYFCRFVKSEASYFNPDRVFECFRKDCVMLEKFEKECDMGVDFGGQVKSKTVITISYLDDDDLIHRLHHKSYEVGKDLDLIEDMEELMTRFNVQRIIPDDCPAGDFLIRIMIEKGWNVEPMNFRSEKVKKYGAFRKHLNKGEVYCYDDGFLKTEMLALENSNTSRQSVIVAPAGYSDDLIDSFVMSCYFFLSDEESTFRIWDWDNLEEDEKISKLFEDENKKILQKGNKI